MMKNMVPTEFYLSQNYPNPFGGKTTIKFCLPCWTRVKLDILTLHDTILKTLVDQEKEAGTFEVEFDAGDLPEGSYICLFQAGDFAESKRMLVKRD